MSSTDCVHFSDLLSSGSNQLANQALEVLSDAVKQGKLDASDENLVKVIAIACLVPLRGTPTRNGLVEGSLPTTRIQAVNILAKLGGAPANMTLTEIISLEPEPAVLESAYRALLVMGARANESLINSMTIQLRDPFPNAPHDSLIMAILTLLLSFQDSYGIMNKPDLFDAIYRLTQNTRYLAITRKQAEHFLKIMMGL